MEFVYGLLCSPSFSLFLITYHSQALTTIDPIRAREDPVIVKNLPHYRAKKALEAEVMKLDPPPRPEKWGELDLPLNSSSWTEEDLKKPEKFYEMTVLLNAQREMADKMLDAQWEAKWRQEKVEEEAKEMVDFLKSASHSYVSGVIIEPMT
ncbi:unnamed protein product [Linum tenue]|uniref:Uncharacterized protein n=1 Tax=Linum tenue TaxID=586396 RepID=A0AAV0M3R8_9ROSI|nr:unnamed protein product [Linum tenue]